MFERKYRINIKELRDLYDAPIWKDSHAVGGNRWASITCKVSGLIECYDAGEKEHFDMQLKEFMKMRHNTGLVCDKLASLKN